jgi:hypothetical protein
MNAKEFIENEKDISRFKLKGLKGEPRPYKARLAEIEKEFLCIDFDSLSLDELGVREAVRLFRVSRPSFYIKYKDTLLWADTFEGLKESTLDRKRYMFERIKILGSNNFSNYDKCIRDLFSCSRLVGERQIARFRCGAMSAAMYLECGMERIYSKVNSLSPANLFYGRSMMDILIDNLHKNWYANYNYFLDKMDFGKIKPLKTLIDKTTCKNDLVTDGYSFATKAKCSGNEHIKVVHLDLLSSDGEDLTSYFSAKLRGGDPSDYKTLDLKYSSDIVAKPHLCEARLLVPSTRSEALAISSLSVVITSLCDQIYKEYHSF